MLTLITRRINAILWHQGVFPPQQQGVFPPFHSTQFQQAQKAKPRFLLFFIGRHEARMIVKGNAWLKSILHDLEPLNVASTVRQ